MLLSNLNEQLFNNAQQLFLVLFSILYGIMLQSISGLQPFPLGRTFNGFRSRPDATNEEKEEYENSVRRCNKTEEELIRMWQKRVVLSIVFLNFFPIAHLSIILVLLRKVAIHPELPWFEPLLIPLVFWSALSVFGFYRIYHAIATRHWVSLFCDVKLEKRPLSFDAKAHLCWGLLFYLSPNLLWLLRLYNIDVIMCMVISLWILVNFAVGILINDC